MREESTSDKKALNGRPRLKYFAVGKFVCTLVISELLQKLCIFALAVTVVRFSNSKHHQLTLM